MIYTDELFYTWATQSIDNNPIYNDLPTEAKKNIIDKTQYILKEYFDKLSYIEKAEFNNFEEEKKNKYIKKVIEVNGNISHNNTTATLALNDQVEKVLGSPTQRGTGTEEEIDKSLIKKILTGMQDFFEKYTPSVAKKMLPVITKTINFLGRAKTVIKTIWDVIILIQDKIF